MNTGSLILGIDLGTTSVSAAVIDTATQQQKEARTINHGADIFCENPAFHEQDAVIICQKATAVIDSLMDKYPGIVSIGITGQMHGAVYTDKEGHPVSNLINWQDKRGDIAFEGDKTYCDSLAAITGMSAYTGYGLVSHYYNTINNIVPENAAYICSIMDLLVMKLTGTNIPVMHASVAASFGLFNAVSNRFDEKAPALSGMDGHMLPDVTDDYRIIGNYRGAKVSVGIGDNQASILGSVKDIENSVLVNIGTGSQISMITDTPIVSPAVEIRPLVKGHAIACASALCGGSSYALLERFFREFTAAAGLSTEAQYSALNSIVKEAYSSSVIPLNVDTSFRGSRHAPDTTGSITGITWDNFTPGALALGFICGMCRELYRHFEGYMDGKLTVVASGNAVQRIPVITDIISNMFSLPVCVSAASEEAASGAALFAAVASGILSSPAEFAPFIKYRED